MATPRSADGLPGSAVAAGSATRGAVPRVWVVVASLALGAMAAAAFPPTSWFWSLPLALMLWWGGLALLGARGVWTPPSHHPPEDPSDPEAGSIDGVPDSTVGSGGRGPSGAYAARVATPTRLLGDPLSPRERWLWTFRAGAWSGLAFGLGLFGVGVHWVFHSLLIFGEAPWVVATVATVLLVLGLSLYVAVTTGVSLALAQALAARRAAAPSRARAQIAQFAARTPVRVPPALTVALLATGWLAAEMARMHWFSGFPWLLTGHVVLDSPLEPWLALFGEMGAGIGIVVLSMAGVLLVLGRLGSRLAALALAALALTTAFALDGGRDLRPDGDSVSVAIVQGNIPQDQKWSEDGVERALETYVAMSEPLVGHDVIVWPETAIPDFYFQVFGPLESVAFAWLEAGSELVTGIFDYDPVEGRMYNSIRHVVSGGVYDKRHLVPFGEFMPARALLGWLDGLLGIPMSDLSPGQGDGLLEIAGTLMGLSICYESAFAQAMAAPMPAAGVLLNVSNDAWFGRSAAPWQHLAIARIRSIELGRPMIRATNTGVSALIDHRGRVMAATALFETATLSGEVQPVSGVTAAVSGNAVISRWLAATTWPALVLVVIGAIVARRGRAR